MKALVTGASGFIGSHLVQALNSQGWETHLLLRENGRRSPQEFANSHVHILSGDPEQLREIVSRVRPDVTFHLASYFLAQHQYTDISGLCESNVTFGTLLADALVQNKCFNLVVAGTAWQNYHEQKGTAVCLYAATKEAFESVLRYYCDATPLKATALKIYDTYGPHDPRGKLLTAVRKAVKAGTTMDLVPGEQGMHMLHVDDVVRAFVIAGERLTRDSSTKGKLEEFYLRAQEEKTLRDLVELFCRVNHVELKANWGARPYREREVMKPWRSGETLPGWTPQVSFEDGLKSFFADQI